MKILSCSLKDIRVFLKNGSVTSKDLSEACLSRIKTIKCLNAFVSVVRDSRNISNDSSLLDGVPVAVKDNYCTVGVKTTCGSKMLEDFVSNFDATVVGRLKESGAVLIGKTNLDEFAMGSGTVDSVHGPTRNVWGSDLDYTVNGKPRKGQRKWRIAGGSSGGSAVAVASGACFAALGSDSGGSTRNPASFCGVVGFKPTYSSVSRHGLIPLVNSMDVPGILTRTVEDAAIIYNTICGIDHCDSTTVPVPKIKLKNDVGKLVIGIPKEYHCNKLSHSVLKAWKHVSSILERNGNIVKTVSLPHTTYSIACYSVLNQCEVASNMARYDGLRYGMRTENDQSSNKLYSETRSQGFNSVVRRRILTGNYFLLHRNYKKYFEKALKVRRLICNDFIKAWNNVDVLLTPTTLTEAPILEDYCNLDNREQCSVHDYCTQPANMAGCPAISIPVMLSESEMPLCIQLIAPNYKDEDLLSLARCIESQVAFPKLDIISK